jgi:hypothetical protein
VTVLEKVGTIKVSPMEANQRYVLGLFTIFGSLWSADRWIHTHAKKAPQGFYSVPVHHREEKATLVIEKEYVVGMIFEDITYDVVRVDDFGNTHYSRRLHYEKD